MTQLEARDYLETLGYYVFETLEDVIEFTGGTNA